MLLSMNDREFFVDMGALDKRRHKDARGQLTCMSVPKVTEALDGAFYRAFGQVEASGKRTLLTHDVSGSMTYGSIAGMPGVTPRVASAAIALIAANAEPQRAFAGFSHELVTINLLPRQRLDDVINMIDRIPMGGTDCSLPMIWAGEIHAAQVLERYRREMSIPAKLIVVGLTATEFSIADPNDACMLDVVGFDTAPPMLMTNFARE